MSRNFELLQKADQAADAIGKQSSGELYAEREEAGQQLGPVTLSTANLTEIAHDQLNKLVNRLFLNPDGAHTVVFSGIERSTGCSWLVAHAAQVLCQQTGDAVCLVDANLRFPILHHMFSIPNHHGLSD